VTFVRPLFAGRTLAFVGLLLFAVNLRTAVTGLSSLVPIVRETYELDTFAVSLIGSLAPLTFALAGIVTPAISRKLGLTTNVLVAIGLLIGGHAVRATSANWQILALGTLVALVGTGLGNVIMPPLVKKYFPDRIGLMTALYLTIITLSAALPPFINVIVAQSFDWRSAMAEWSVTATLAAIPWVMLFARSRKEHEEHEAQALASRHDMPQQVGMAGALYRSPTAVAIAFLFSASSIAGYAVYTWLPSILISTSRVDIAQAGALLSFYSLLGTPFALVTPIIAQRLGARVNWLITGAAITFALGFWGLWIAPEGLALFWVSVLGVGAMVFPISMALVNLRTESQFMSLRLSGYVQSIGYLAAALAPPLMGLSFDATGSWNLALFSVGAVLFLATTSGFVLKRNRSIEQELALR
jgi:CP family cyanate transporter-like MFS transporter